MYSGVCPVGTGKSTLVKYLIAELGLKNVVFATFTGKASLVLRQNGNENSMTLHKLLYNSFPNNDGTFRHVPKVELDEHYDLIVVDEVSMVPIEIWQLLIRHKIHIIALGDPFQLPAIGEDNGILQKPHVFLTEVMRQALESDIIKLSMEIREGKKLTPFDGKDVKVINKKDLSAGMLLWADQIICGKNTTRHAVNKNVRALKEHGEEPQVGDKVICIKNYWDRTNRTDDPLINGMIGTLSNPRLVGSHFSASFTPEHLDSSGIFEGLRMDYQLLKEGNPTYATGQPTKRKNPLLLFEYGYAITCWKAQGSQYNKVLFLTEKVGKMDQTAYNRFLYTGVTRAIDKLVVVI